MRGLFSGIVFVSVLVSIVWPKSIVGILPILAISGVLIRGKIEFAHKERLSIDGLTIGFVGFCGYLVINSSWAMDSQVALGKAGEIILFTTLSFAFIRFTLADPRHLSGLSSASLIAGVIAGAAFIAHELNTGSALTRALFNLVPMLRPEGGKNLDIDMGEITAIYSGSLNRSVGVLMLAVWPALLAASRLRSAWIRKTTLVSLSAVTLISVFTSEHATSMSAVIVGASAFVLFTIWPRFTRWSIATLWLGAFVSIIPLSIAAYEADLHKADWMPTTARARIILWNTTSLAVSEAPIVGKGIRSTQIAADAQEFRKQPSDHVYPLHTGRHAHNIYLQTWYELGLIGVLLLASLGMMVLRRIATLDRGVQPYAYAHYVTFMTIAAFSWGMWQSWYLAAVALAPVLMTIAAGSNPRSAT